MGSVSQSSAQGWNCFFEIQIIEDKVLVNHYQLGGRRKVAKEREGEEQRERSRERGRERGGK